jgi:hypothetical protein
MVDGKLISAAVYRLTSTIMALHPPKNSMTGHTRKSAVAVRAWKMTGNVLCGGAAMSEMSGFETKCASCGVWLMVPVCRCQVRLDSRGCVAMGRGCGCGGWVLVDIDKWYGGL